MVLGIGHFCNERGQFQIDTGPSTETGANNKAPLLRVSSGVRMQSTNYELLALRGSRLSRYKRLDEGQTPPPDDRPRSNHEGIGP